MNDRVTIKTIADLSGLSIGTVDRALNNRGRISKSTKEKILNIANEVGYKPNKLASTLSKNQNINLAAVFPLEPRYYFDTIKNGMLDAQKELHDYKVHIKFHHTESLDPVKQIKVVKNIDLTEINGLMISPGGASLDCLINSFVNNDIPTITFANDSPSSKRFFYIGQDMDLAGMLGGELIGKLLKGTGIVLTLVAFSNVYSLEKRYLGFEKVMKNDYPNIKIEGPYEFFDEDKKAYETVLKILRKNDVDGIFVASASGTVGAAMALEEYKSTKIPILVGFDDVDYIKEKIKQGIITATITQDPYSQGYYAVKLLVKNILENWRPKTEEIFTHSRILMKSNIKDEDFNKALMGLDL